MADRALGKLLAKSKSIRRGRKGSVDGNSSIGSDEARLSSSSISHAPTTVGRFSQQFPSPSQFGGTDATGLSPYESKGYDEESTSLLSYDSEGTDLDR